MPVEKSTFEPIRKVIETATRRQENKTHEHRQLCDWASERSQQSGRFKTEAYLDIWTSAVKAKSSSGRGSSKKRELYGIKKLRELILELAVRGKLVAQDSTDEPASVLLECIAAEKAKLVIDKKIKKQKTLPAVGKDEVSFDLPLGWQWCRVGHLFLSIASGGTPSKREPAYWEGEIPWASVKDLGNAKFIYDTQDHITKAGLISGSRLANPEDLLICTRMGLGKIAIVKNPMAFNQDLKSVKLSQYVQTDFFLNSYSTIKISGTGTTVAGITQDQLLSYIFALPPLSEQHRIVTKVDELMALCDQLEQQTESSLDAHQLLVETLLTTLTNSQDATELMANWTRISEHFDTLFTTELSIETLKQTILQLAVMGKLVVQDSNDEPAAKLLERIAEEKAQLVIDKKIKKQKALCGFKEDEVGFTLPEGWAWARMGNLAHYQKGFAFKSKDYLARGLMITKIQNLTENHTQNSVYITPDREEEFAQYILCEGDIVMTTVGSWFSAPVSAVGRTFLINSTFHDSLLNQNAVRVRTFAGLESMYLFACVNSPIFKKYLIQEAQGTANQASITQESIRNFLICVPPRDEQNRIVAKLGQLMALCDQLKQRLRDNQQTQLLLTDAIVEQAL